VKEPVDSIYSPAWNADETRLAISARDTLLIWSLPDGKLLGTFPDLGQYQAVFSPDKPRPGIVVAGL